MKKSVILALLLIVMVSMVSVVSAAGYGSHAGHRGDAWRLVSAGLTLEQAASKVRKESGGKLLSADERGKNGNRVYRFKVLMPDGVVRFITIDPATGSPLPSQQ